ELVAPAFRIQHATRCLPYSFDRCARGLQGVRHAELVLGGLLAPLGLCLLDRGLSNIINDPAASLHETGYVVTVVAQTDSSQGRLSTDAPRTASERLGTVAGGDQKVRRPRG